MSQRWFSVAVVLSLLVLTACGGSREPVSQADTGQPDALALDQQVPPEDGIAEDGAGPDLRRPEDIIAPPDLVMPDQSDSVVDPCEGVDCVMECTADSDCPPGFLCEITTDGCCSSCVQDDPCALVECLYECDVDSDCSVGESCVKDETGCCSECQPVACEMCFLEAGDYCPGTPPDALCEVGQITVESTGVCTFAITYAGDSGTDTFEHDGCGDFNANLENTGCGLQFEADSKVFLVACNWCGQVPYAQEYCGCVPNCEGKECGDDGCGGQCGICAAEYVCSEGQCVPGAEPLVELEPLCVHVPAQVQAGADFPVAVYGTAGCGEFVDYTVEQSGTEYTVKLWGSASPDPDCPPLATCNETDYRYSGIIWLEAPNPGGYTVTVGDFTAMTGASGGLISEPDCDDVCPQFELDMYMWTLLMLGDDEPSDLCLEPDHPAYIGSGLDITGSCQNYTMAAVQELPEMPVFWCNPGHLFFGPQAPYWMDATQCGTDPMVDGHLPIILGTIQESLGAPVPTQLFVVEGIPLWN